MSDDDAKVPAPPEPKVATVDTTSTPVLSENALSVLDQQVADPEILLLGLRYLQQRIPGFVQLTVRERQSMTRSANLDPEFREIGIQVGGAWNECKSLIKRDGRELRQEEEDIRKWNEVERELRALLKGVSDANLKRKAHLGEAVLMIYGIVGTVLEHPWNAHLRGLWEQMQGAYLKAVKKARKKTAKSEEPKPEEP